jgi:hypothetical protein
LSLLINSCSCYLTSDVRLLINPFTPTNWAWCVDTNDMWSASGNLIASSQTDLGEGSNTILEFLLDLTQLTKPTFKVMIVTTYKSISGHLTSNVGLLAIFIKVLFS